MARHPTARRVQRHRKTTEPDDVFVEGVLETSAWAKENARLLIISITAVVVLLTGFLYYRNRAVMLRDAAETELTGIRQTVLSGNAGLAIRDLETYLQRFGGTATAAEARVLLARSYLDNQEPQKAIETVSELASDLSEPLGVSAAILLGSAYEAAAEPDRAIEVYLRVADGAPFVYQQRDALDNAARVRTQIADPAGAVELYDRILELLPADDPDRPVFELRRAEAAAREYGVTTGS